MAKRLRADGEDEDLYSTSAATCFNSLVIRKLGRVFLSNTSADLFNTFLTEYSAQLAKIKTLQDGEYTCFLVCQLDDNIKMFLLVQQLQKPLKILSIYHSIYRDLSSLDKMV